MLTEKNFRTFHIFSILVITFTYSYQLVITVAFLVLDPVWSLTYHCLLYIAHWIQVWHNTTMLLMFFVWTISERLKAQCGWHCFAGLSFYLVPFHSLSKLLLYLIERTEELFPPLENDVIISTWNCLWTQDILYEHLCHERVHITELTQSFLRH